MSSWWLGFTRDLHPDPSNAKKVPELPRISKPKNFKNIFFLSGKFYSPTKPEGHLSFVEIWDFGEKVGFLFTWPFDCFALRIPKKPGLTIHTQRTVVICQIQKAIATVNANAASWKVREKVQNPPSSGGEVLGKDPQQKHPAVLPEEVAMFNFYSVLVFIDSGKKVKQMGFRPWFFDTDRKNTPRKKPEWRIWMSKSNKNESKPALLLILPALPWCITYTFDTDTHTWNRATEHFCFTLKVQAAGFGLWPRYTWCL